MPQKPLGKKPAKATKKGQRHAPTGRITKKGAPSKPPKKASELEAYKGNKAISKIINKRNEERSAALAQRGTSSHKLKNKDLKALDEPKEGN